MDDIDVKPRDLFDKKLFVLYQEACQYPQNSPKRNLLLHKIYRLITTEGRQYLIPRKNAGNVDFYEDLLSDALTKFMPRLCEEYKPKSGRIMSWFNNGFLKYELQGFYRQNQRELDRYVRDRQDEDGKSILDGIASPSDDNEKRIREVMDELIEDIETNPIYQECHLKGRSEVNCKVLLQIKGFNRFLKKENFSQFTKSLNISNSAADSHYSRNCKSLVIEFFKQRGIGGFDDI